MTRWPFKLLLLLSVAAALVPSVNTYRDRDNRTVLTVGYLTAIKGEMKDKQGLAISGALTMALDEVRVELFKSVRNATKAMISPFFFSD